MKIGVCILGALCVLSLVAGCSRSDATATELPTHMPQPVDTLEPTATMDLATNSSTPTCPPARGEGTISPTITIYSIVFVVNGVEQIVRDGDMLQALPGELVQVREVTICVGSYSDNGGEACVDFAPVARGGQELVSEHSGTHTVRVTPGFMSISGLDHRWTIGENWKHISVVLNHWPSGGTEDLGCGSGRCERDDRIIIGFE